MTAVAALALGLAVLTGGVAAAATPGVTTNLVLNGSQTYNGVPVVHPGDTETLQVQYDDSEVTPGSTVKIKLGDNVTIGTLPPGDSSVKSITKDPDDPSTVDITFADPLPSGISQGVLSLGFTINQVSTSAPGQLTWDVDGTANSQNVIILKPGDTPENVTDSQSKSVSGNFNGLATVDADGNVTLPATAAGKTVSYTVTASTTAANAAYPISDQLAKDLDYVPGSFAATLTTWDSNGLNETTNPVTPFAPAVTGDPASGESFSTTANLPADSVLKVTYQAQIPPANSPAFADLQAQLQAAYNANKANLQANGGSYSISLANTATIGGTPKTATTTMSGNVTGPSKPNVGQAFGKTSDWSSQNATADADGTLTPPVAVTYTLTANLSQWDGSDSYKTLAGNVVISDPLPSQATWNTGASDFVTASGITLTPATGTCDATLAVDTYCVAGQTLYVNVGQSNTTNASIQAKALVNSVTGLTKGTTTVQGATDYVLPNIATFSYSSTDGPHTYPATRNVNVVTGGNTPNGYNDPSVFAKTTSPSQVTVDPGQSATVTYTFTANTSSTVNATDVQIVDPVDSTVFDTSDLSAIAAQLSGSYGSTTLTAADFTLTKNGAGALVIALSDAGKAAVGGGTNGKWTVTMPLTTVPVVGKQTIAITNTATLEGSNGTPMYYSTVASSVTSYGSEAEVRKTVYDSTGNDWTTNLRAQLDANGNLADSTYVYQVQFVPHGGYNNVTIVPVNDVLPAGEQFLGFESVDANGAPTGNPTNGPVPVGGNIQASYDSTNGTMSLTQTPGTVLDASQPIVAYFAVKITSFTPDVPIVNKIGSAAATITPTDGYPLTIAKQDSTDQSKVINDPNARFQLKDAAGKVVVDNIFVSDGYLRVAGTNGQPAAVKVSQPGTYTLSEVTPPAGYVKSDDTLTFQVSTDSIPAAQTFYDAPVGPSVSVGDYVWVDSNHNGRQDAGEPGIPGVVLTITGPDGKPVTGVNGLPVGPVTTDANGKYSFTGLPVLSAGQHYTVAIDQAASAKALAPYTPTTAGVGDRTADSSTGSAQSQGLTGGGQSDLTLDFGFVTKTYAIGDKVWIDSNGNGIQDGDEPPLAGVTVTLLDGSGKAIATTTTNAQGLYKFDNLPAGTYQVKFQLTPAQATKYKFTSTGKGTVATDSNANQSTGLTSVFTLDDSDTNLTTGYTAQTVTASQGIDPTWDAGVVVVTAPPSTSTTAPSTSMTPPTSTTSPSSTPPTTQPPSTDPTSTGAPDPLAYTGTNTQLQLLVAGLLLSAGLLLTVIGMRRRRGHHTG